jgi:hypothetical protein
VILITDFNKVKFNKKELKKMTDDKDGWNEWAHRVLGDIDILTKLNAICVDIAVLKTKAAFIGGLWGAIMAVVTAVIIKLIGR